MTGLESLVLVVQIGSCLFMTGLIWFVQVVHYPLFRVVEPASCAAFSREHQRRTGWIAAPVMVVELCTAFWLLAIDVPAMSMGARAWALAALLIIWISTFAVQVPLHRRLAHGFDASAAQRLVRYNWIRTLLWSVRSLLLLASLARALA